MNHYSKFALAWFVLLFLQIFLFNQIAIGDWAYAIVFPLALLMLPLQMNLSLAFLIAFFTGLIIDLSVWRMGIHTFTSVTFIAVRGTWINFITPQLSVAEKEQLVLPEQTLDWQFTYIGPLFLVYAFIYFLLLDFGFSLNSILSFIITGIYSSFLAMLVFILVYRSPKK